MKNEVLQLGKEFAKEIVACKEYQLFTLANKDLNNNQEAIDLIRFFNQKQMQLRQEGVSENLLDELQNLQEQINTNTAIQRLQTAQQELVALLQETNEVISNQIGMPFALAKGGGCCG